MPATNITTSPNITSLDSRIEANLCTGFFYVDVTPSVFLPGGTSTSGGVQGATVRITNPLGIVIKQYSTSGFDIYPPMDSRVSVLIPKTAGNYVYGTYTFDVKLTDDDGTEYTVTKTVNLCPPDPNNKNKKDGCLNAKIYGNCKDGKVVILLDQPPNYKGKMFSSQVIDMDLQYPTSSGLPTREGINIPSFSVILYEGEYILTGTTCVYYSYGDNVFYNINYKINCKKNIKCIIDLCCVQAKWEELSARLDSDCTIEEKQETMGIIVESQFYVNAAQGAANCGGDPSSWIEKLELLLGCVCTCNCNEGTPIIDNTPAKDFLIEGCNIEKTTEGLTDHYTINNYSYKVVLAEGSDAGLTLSEPELNADNCEYVQTLNYTAPGEGSVDFIYRALLSQSGTGNPTAIPDSRNTVTIAWTRVSAGVYRGTITTIDGVSILTLANTFPIISPSLVNTDLAALYESSTTVKVLTSVVDAGIPTDSLLNHTPFELNILL